MRFPVIFLIFGFLITKNFAAEYKVNFDGRLRMEISLGTPYQKPVSFLFDSAIDKFEPHLTMDSKSYDSSRSSTFKQISKKGNSVIGSDVAAPVDGPQLGDVKLNISSTVAENYLSLSHGENGTKSFADKMLEAVDFEAITFVIEGFVGLDAELAIFGGFSAKNLSSRDYHKGSVIFGPSAPKVCSPDWEVFAAAHPGSAQFAIQTSEISAVRYHSTFPLALAFSSNGTIELEKTTLSLVAYELGARGRGEISCDEERTIVIRAGGQKWEIGPDDYLKYTGTRRCIFALKPSPSGGIRLPLRFLKSKCLRYNFDWMTVGISNMVVN